MSKFDFAEFFDGHDSELALSMERYSFDEARAIAASELDGPVTPVEGVWCVRWRFGLDLDDDPIDDWFLDPGNLPRSCAVWVFERM